MSSREGIRWFKWCTRQNLRQVISESHYRSSIIAFVLGTLTIVFSAITIALYAISHPLRGGSLLISILILCAFIGYRFLQFIEEKNLKKRLDNQGEIFKKMGD